MRLGTKRAHYTGVKKDHKHTVPAPTHCFGCDQPFDGEPICYDTRYPVLVEVERVDGTITLQSVVAAFHENCKMARRSVMFALQQAIHDGKPHP